MEGRSGVWKTETEVEEVRVRRRKKEVGFEEEGEERK